MGSSAFLKRMKRLNEKRDLTEKHTEQPNIWDQRAFGALYDRFRPKVYTYALKITGSAETAEDIAQEVFLKIWQYQGFEKVDNVDAYLRVVTRNLALKWLRRNILERKVSREMRDYWNEADISTEQTVNLKETQAAIDRAVALLPPQRRLVFQLCKNERLKYGEVADRTKLSRFTVKTHMQLALRFLRDYMAKYDNVIILLLAILLHRI